MQLLLELLDLPTQPGKSPPTPLGPLDEAARVAALDIVSRLIGRMLAPSQIEEAIND